MNRLRPIIISSGITLIVVTIIFSMAIRNDSNNQSVLWGSLFSSNRSSYQQRQPINSDITNERQNIITKTVAHVSPAVVGISVTEIRQYRDPWSIDPFWRQF